MLARAATGPRNNIPRAPRIGAGLGPGRPHTGWGFSLRRIGTALADGVSARIWNEVKAHGHRPAVQANAERALPLAQTPNPAR